jgi:hypothetical protein
MRSERRLASSVRGRVSRSLNRHGHRALASSLFGWRLLPCLSSQHPLLNPATSSFLVVQEDIPGDQINDQKPDRLHELWQVDNEVRATLSFLCAGVARLSASCGDIPALLLFNIPFDLPWFGHLYNRKCILQPDLEQLVDRPFLFTCPYINYDHFYARPPQKKTMSLARLSASCGDIPALLLFNIPFDLPWFGHLYNSTNFGKLTMRSERRLASSVRGRVSRSLNRHGSGGMYKGFEWPQEPGKTQRFMW